MITVDGVVGHEVNELVDAQEGVVDCHDFKSSSLKPFQITYLICKV
jgi:hypothetical protein